MLRRSWPKLAAIVQESHHKTARIAPETPVRDLHSGPLACTASVSGVAGGKKGASSPPLQEFGIEYQLQLVRRCWLGLPVLELEKVGVGDELEIARFARGSVRSIRRCTRTGVCADRPFPRPQ